MVSKVARFGEKFMTSNAAFPTFRGMVLEGRVEKIEDRFSLVNTGFKNLTKLPNRELDMPGVELAVGSTRRFVVEHTNNYLGEMDLNMNKIVEEQRNTATWNELKLAYERNVNVMGRVLNNVNTGYAVGLAGHVAFLPKTRANKAKLRAGKLLPFQILRFNDATRNIVVAMPGVTIFSRENYGNQVPTLPEGGWTQYLRSLRMSSKEGDGAGGALKGPALDLPVDAPVDALDLKFAQTEKEKPAPPSEADPAAKS